MIKVSVVFGTRPEAIKMAMLIKAFEKRKEIELNVCFTGQHKEMVLPLIDFFELTVHHSLDIMRPNQTLAGLSARSFDAVDAYLQEVKPDIVLVQGDTTTAMCAATAAFYRKIKVGHVEAGLRTYNMQSPFPEEFNRQVISKITDLHFAPTKLAGENLAKEHADASTVFVTGNTVIDALQCTQKKISEDAATYKRDYPWTANGKPFILITGHRRENFGSGFENMCHAIKELSVKYSGYNFVYPVHLNPNVQKPVQEILSGQENIYLIPPLDYIQFTSLLAGCYFVLTDSGGVQEEAPGLGKPVLVMRDTTERQEAVTAGVAMLVGTDKEKIILEASRLIEDKEAYKKMSTAQNPFGKGDSAEQIVEQVIRYFSKE
ncbi:MAG: UDP-N-acetylglucosamine 2-epimerase (non-hydrolyzing) [Chitinophagaceae bacterium]|nr:UDP-N-acetylglucosamine 2-epimerase (non-hydrolyzing) [Chitinophagaceae bacterium]